MDNEQALIQRAQKGDHDAFAALVDEHQLYVYNLALRVVKDENEALDLAQERRRPLSARGRRCQISKDSHSFARGCIALSQIFAITVYPTCAVP